jgi:nucleotide-binding universal stress UspA family protein
MSNGSDYTSILDKTDWRKTIHKALEEAVLSIGMGKIFYYRVERAIQSIKAQYPNWNATKEINEGIKKIIDKHNNIAERWIDTNRLWWAYPWNQELKKMEWKDKMYIEILQFLLDTAGKHRMLLWGIRSVPEGSIGSEEITDVSRNETDP